MSDTPIEEGAEATGLNEDFELTPESLEALGDKLEGKEEEGEPEKSPDTQPKEDDKPSTEEEPQVGDEKEAPTEEIPQYQPNFEYKVVNKMFEFDDRVKEAIKSKEDEEYFRDLYTKAHGLDITKSNFERTQSEYQALQNDVSEVVDAVNRFDLKTALEKLEVPTNDLGVLLKGLGVDDNQLIRLAYEKAQLQDLTPEQKQAYNQQVDQRVENHRLSQQNQTYQQMIEQQKLESRNLELDHALNQQSLAEIREKFEADNGSGKFRDLVIETGKMLSRTQGREVTVQEAVQAARETVDYLEFQKMRSQPQQPTQPQAQTMPQTPQQPARKAAEEVPTIPAVGDGAGGSPGSRAINSIEDLEKIYQQEYGSGF